MTTKVPARKELGFHRTYAFWIMVLVLVRVVGKVIEAYLP